MIDTASGVVLDVEAAPARKADEPEAARRMVERMRDRRVLVPDILTADTAYGSVHFFGWGERTGVEIHAPIMNTRDGTGRRPSREAFRYDPGDDSYTCPQGKMLRPAKRHRARRANGGHGTTVSYFPSRRDCAGCPIQSDCAPSGARTIQLAVDGDARDRARAREGTAGSKRTQKLWLRVERLFADIKHGDGLRRLRLRGRRAADEQFILAATARNLGKMAMLLAPRPAVI